eukprot:c23814_g3_i1 orf=588-1472(+)
MLDLNAFPGALTSVQASTQVDLTADSTIARMSSTSLKMMDSNIHEAIDYHIVLTGNKEENSGGSLEPESSGCDEALSVVAQALSKTQAEQSSDRGEVSTLKDLSEDYSGTSISSVVNAITTEAASPEFEASSQGSAENEDRLAEEDSSSNNAQGKYKDSTAVPPYKVGNRVHRVFGYTFGGENEGMKVTENLSADINDPSDEVSPKTVQTIVTRQFLPLEPYQISSTSDVRDNHFPRAQWMGVTVCQEDNSSRQKPLDTVQPVKKSRRGPRSKSSEYRGVTFYRRTGRWESHIW